MATDGLLLPVMYYIHGGSFYAGSAYDFFPDFLLEEDMVLVVVQYRLGILGNYGCTRLLNSLYNSFFFFYGEMN